MFDVFSVKRMYNIKVSTGKNTWFLMKINDGDDDDYDELCYSFIDIMSGSTIILCQFSGFIETVSSHNGSTRPDWQTEAVCS